MKQQLKQLLDSFTYRKAEDGRYYTPREDYERQYDDLIEVDGIEKYFSELVDEGLYTQAEAKEALEEVRGETVEETAFNIIEQSLYLLDGATVEAKETKC